MQRGSGQEAPVQLVWGINAEFIRDNRQGAQRRRIESGK